MISILIPAYNAEKHLNECLNSILNQTSKNYEVIIVDDGSNDNTYLICENYLDKMNIKLYSRENKGVTYTRNELIKYATGEYLIFLDSDDILEKNTIFYLTNILNNNDDIDAIFYDIKQFKTENFQKEKGINSILIEKYSKEKIAIDFLTIKRRGYVAGILINKLKWNNLGIKFTLEKYVEDWFPIFYYAVNCNILYYVHASLYMYRQQETSAIATTGLKVIGNYVTARNLIYKYSKNELDIKRKYINCFLVRTDLDIIHELSLVNINFYKFAKKYKCGLPKMVHILSNNIINSKEKVIYLLFKLKLYYLFKLLLINIRKNSVD